MRLSKLIENDSCKMDLPSPKTLLGSAIARASNTLAKAVVTSGDEAPTPQSWTVNRAVCGQLMAGKGNEKTHPTAEGRTQDR